MVIKVLPVNHTYIKIDCDQGPARELHDYFTITIPNPQFRKKGWNGKIRLFNWQTKQIYRGLLFLIKEWAKENGHDLDVGGLDIQNEISMHEVNQFIGALQPSDGRTVITPHEHQLKALVRALRAKRLLILSPTASGKSLIIYFLIRSILMHTKKKILIIVPTINLVSQLFGDFVEYSQINQWSTLNNCHLIWEGKEKYSEKPVFISTWQSLYQLPPEYFHQFGCVIGDEAHLYATGSCKAIFGNCINASYRFGLTGTINDTKAHILTLQGLFGPIYQAATTKQLIDEKKLSQFEIKCILLKHQSCDAMNYRDELQYLIFNQARNKYIRNLALSLKNNTLILYQFVEKHGQILYEMLNEANIGNKRNIYFISGKVDMEAREDIRKIAETQNNAIIVASYGTFSTGANMKNLHNIIFASPSKGRVRVCQSIGRELRLHNTKETAYLFDIADDLDYKTQKKNFTLDHFMVRLGIYHQEKFTYKTYRIELKG